MNSGCQPFIQMSVKFAKGNLGADDDADAKPALKSVDGIITKSGGERFPLHYC